MNKTLEYALSEALEKGYRAGRIGNTFDEMALRERIAQEIESWEVQSDSTNLNPEVYKIIKQTFANVARGTNDK